MQHAIPLIIGLALFLGVHSVRIFADGWRTRFIAERGEKTWKLGYTVVSIVGLALTVWGYGQARASGIVLYDPPAFMRHITALLAVIAFVLFAAAYVPRNHIRRALGHPMTIGTKTWAFGHLLSNGGLADVLLFGGFLVWAVLLFRSARRRPAGSSQGPVPDKGPASGAMTALTVVIGLLLGIGFALLLHAPMTGVRPF